MREWDAASYDRVADPQTRWALAVLDRLPLRGDEIVVDGGCGTGRATEALVGRLPLGRVLAVDASEAMARRAEQRLAPSGRAAMIVGDLLGLPLGDGAIDAFFSTATFHWIPDHSRLFSEIARVLRTGGKLVAQCGGAGNTARLVAAAQAEGAEGAVTRMLAGAEQTERRLAQSGFVDVRAWLEDAPARFDSDAIFEEFLTTVCLRAYLPKIPARNRKSFVRSVAARLSDRTIDYVRLNIDARIPE
jgi:trans-aconitate 2-methyltransferase